MRVIVGNWIVSRTPVEADSVAATMNPDATHAATEILRLGGNAVDAAVAASFALAVVEPFHSGLGGLTSILYRDGRTRRTHALDGTAVLPRAMHPEAYPIAAGDEQVGVYGWPRVEGDMNILGPQSIAIPGAVGALCEAQRRWGSMTLQTVMEPAISLARNGIEVDWFLASAIAAVQSDLLRFPSTANVFLRPDGTCLRPGILGMVADHLVQADLADSLDSIARGGPEAFYQGELASRLINALADAGSVLDHQDLAGYSPRYWDEPLETEYHGYRIQGVPDNTGAPTMLEALNILDCFGTKRWPADGIERAHVTAEALRRAFADRFELLGDSRESEVRSATLASKSHATSRAASIHTSASRSRAPRNSAAGAGDPPWRPDDADTTHVTVVDRLGNAAAITSTIGSVFGSTLVAGDTGILMNNGTMWFNPVPGTVNSIGPGRRTLVAGCPTFALAGERLAVALGAPGGRKIISAVLQVLVNIIDLSMDPQQAIDSPRLHAEDDRTVMDSRYPAAVIEGLRERGHRVELRTEGIGTGWFARPNAVVASAAGLRAGVYPLVPSSAAGIGDGSS